MKSTKIKLIGIMAAMLLSIVSYAQNISIGARTGINITNVTTNIVSSDILPESNFKNGFSGGLFVDIPLKNGFSFAPEILYTQKGSITKKTTGFDVAGMNVPVGAKAHTRFNYLEIPALFRYNMGNENWNSYVTIGPSISYATKAHIQTKASLLIDINVARIDLDLNDAIYNRIDYGGVIGIGTSVKAGEGKIFADVRYQHSLNDVLANPIVDVKVRNYGFNIGVGYAHSL